MTGKKVLAEEPFAIVDVPPESSLSIEHTLRLYVRAASRDFTGAERETIKALLNALADLKRRLNALDAVWKAEQLGTVRKGITVFDITLNPLIFQPEPERDSSARFLDKKMVAAYRAISDVVEAWQAGLHQDQEENSDE